MEGLMLCCPRPKPAPWVGLHAPSAAALRREVRPITPVAGESGRQRHSNACCLGSAAVPSIWHAITPYRALPTRRWRRGSSAAEEGSWNAAWDARPARWLHGSDSAWLLFGVCQCFFPSDQGGVNQTLTEKEADAPVAAAAAEAEGSTADHYKVTGMLSDGRCLFRAVVYGACLSAGKEAPDEMQQKELADDLRARVVDELLKRRNEIERFIEEDFDIYIERIRQPYIWGGEPELLMASHIFQTPISVFMMDKSSSRLINIANYGQEYEKNKDRSIKVLFHDYGHYDALEILTRDTTVENFC